MKGTDVLYKKLKCQFRKNANIFAYSFFVIDGKMIVDRTGEST